MYLPLLSAKTYVKKPFLLHIQDWPTMIIRALWRTFCISTLVIDEKLPANMRSDYLKLKNKGKLTKSRKNKIIKKLQEIIDGEIQDEEG